MSTLLAILLVSFGMVVSGIGVPSSGTSLSNPAPTRPRVDVN